MCAMCVLCCVLICVCHVFCACRADEALHQEAVEKHFSGTNNLFESELTSVRSRVRWTIMSIKEELQVGSISQVSTHYLGDVQTGLGQRPGSQTVTSFFPKTNLSHDGLRCSRSIEGIYQNYGFYYCKKHFCK